MRYKFSFNKDKKSIQKLSENYDYPLEECIVQITKNAKRRGYYKKNEFRSVCFWKIGPRKINKWTNNSEKDIVEITKKALKQPDTEKAIKILEELSGVGRGIASTLLHFGHENPFPIIDKYAIFAAYKEKLNYYSYKLWDQYVKDCREFAEKRKIEMRILDKALWVYGKEKWNTKR